jgi:hypothetical protein
LGADENALEPQPGALQDVVELLNPSGAVMPALVPVLVPVPLSTAVMTGEIKFQMRAATAPSLEPCQHDADIIDEKPKLIT